MGLPTYQRPSPPRRRPSSLSRALLLSLPAVLAPFSLDTVPLCDAAAPAAAFPATDPPARGAATTSPRPRTASPRYVAPGDGLDRGFNVLELAGRVVPQGWLVQTAREGWKFAWKRMMAELAPQDKSGAYRRPSYAFGGRIGDDDFPDVAGRYHLYVGNPCPWCHRARLVLALRSVSTSEVGVTRLIDDPVRASRGGWVFESSSEESRDPLGSYDLRELYDRLSPSPGGFRGRCTAPLLVDLAEEKIVSNESSDIVRMLGGATFGDAKKERMELYPPELSELIDETNSWVYELLNNGVYRCGFSTAQSAYDDASADVREGLRRCEEILSDQEYLCGHVLTEADLRLLPTALRFDGAYAPLFRAGGAHLRLRDFPALHGWLRRCWAVPGVADSVDLADACGSYYRQLFPLNAGGIVPTPVTAEEIGLVGDGG